MAQNIPYQSVSDDEIQKALREIKKIKQTQENSQTVQKRTGKGAKFVYTAATVANVLCDNLSETQINLLANFLAVVTTCCYAILEVDNPSIIEDETLF